MATKEASLNNELVLVKDLIEVKKDILLDYPKFNLLENNKFLLAIYPQYHTRLFPDSILNNEDFDIIKDVSHTNSIEKVYICQMDCSKLKKDDIILIYRTKADDDPGKAHYRSVVTSICTIEEIKTKQNFTSLNDYLTYCESYSVFNRQELTDWYNKKGGLYIIKMVYNAAFRKRVTRGNLIENFGLSSTDRWNIVSLSNDQFNKIIKQGNVYESLIIN
jgi:CMP-N-acetylneuraminic acid synthetase